MNVMSFGYNNGVPLDADFMFDVRFLNNPFYKSELRDKTGLDIAVADYVFSQNQASDFVKSISNLMIKRIPSHSAAGKTSLTIAIVVLGENTDLSQL